MLMAILIEHMTEAKDLFFPMLDPFLRRLLAPDDGSLI